MRLPPFLTRTFIVVGFACSIVLRDAAAQDSTTVNLARDSVWSAPMTLLDYTLLQVKEGVRDRYVDLLSMRNHSLFALSGEVSRQHVTGGIERDTGVPVIGIDVFVRRTLGSRAEVCAMFMSLIDEEIGATAPTEQMRINVLSWRVPPSFGTLSDSALERAVRVFESSLKRRVTVFDAESHQFTTCSRFSVASTLVEVRQGRLP